MVAARTDVSTAESTLPHATMAEFTGHVAQAAGGVLDASNAQLNIWSMHALRLVLLFCLGTGGTFALVALGVYGFILLDQAAGVFFYTPAMPWLSPLLRSFTYLSFTALALAIVWHAFIGYGNAGPKGGDRAIS